MAYAEVSDIEARLKPQLGRELNADEKAAAELLLEGATAVIDEATEKPEPDPEPKVLRFVSVEVVCRAMSNPQGLASEEEELGSYSYAQSFLKEGGGLWLTELERLMARNAVHGSLSGSALPKSLPSDTYLLGQLAPGSYPWWEENEEDCDEEGS